MRLRVAAPVTIGAALLTLFLSGVVPTTASAAQSVVISNAATGRCLDDYNGIYTYGCDGSATQAWLAHNAGPGAVFQNQGTNACLTDNEQGDAVPDTCRGGPNQVWEMFSLGGNQWMLRSLSTQQCLKAEYREVWLQECDEADPGQAWALNN